MSSLAVKSSHAALKFEILNPEIRNNIEIIMFKIGSALKLIWLRQRPLDFEHWDLGH